MNTKQRNFQALANCLKGLSVIFGLLFVYVKLGFIHINGSFHQEMSILLVMSLIVWIPLFKSGSFLFRPLYGREYLVAIATTMGMGIVGLFIAGSYFPGYVLLDIGLWSGFFWTLATVMIHAIFGPAETATKNQGYEAIDLDFRKLLFGFVLVAVLAAIGFFINVMTTLLAAGAL